MSPDIVELLVAAGLSLSSELVFTVIK